MSSMDGQLGMQAQVGGMELRRKSSSESLQRMLHAQMIRLLLLPWVVWLAK
jgi:hypothetical protein